MMSSVKGASHLKEIMEFEDVACRELTAERVPVIRIIKFIVSNLAIILYISSMHALLPSGVK